MKTSSLILAAVNFFYLVPAFSCPKLAGEWKLDGKGHYPKLSIEDLPTCGGLEITIPSVSPYPFSIKTEKIGGLAKLETHDAPAGDGRRHPPKYADVSTGAYLNENSFLAVFVSASTKWTEYRAKGESNVKHTLYRLTENGELEVRGLGTAPFRYRKE
jgi:hypothetical protein